MHLTNCLNPVEVIRYGEKHYVPCGKCEYCRFVRNSALSTRLKYEMSGHKFGVFGTLTYADMFLPKMVYLHDSRGFVVPDSLVKSDCSVFSDCGLFIPFPFQDKKSAEYIEHRMETFGYIPRLRKKDVQDFFKRLRANIFRKYKLKDKSKYEKEKFTITYACCGEYGPTTFRPHYHFVLMFDEESLAKDIFNLIHKSWRYGSSRCRFTTPDESGDYCTKYLNCSYSLPSLFKLREIRPFFLASKAHPLGLPALSKEEVQRIVFTGSPEYRVFDVQKKSYTKLPLPSVFENRFFPKFSGFDRVPNWLRVRLLRLSMQQTSCKEFIDLVTTDIDALRHGFPEIRHYVYSSAVSDYFHLYFKDYSSDYAFKEVISNVCRSLFYCGRKIRYMMHLCCVDSLEDYLSLIDTYYHNKVLYKLSLQMELEDKVMKHTPELIEKIDLSCFSDAVLDSFDMKYIIEKIRHDIEHSHKNKRKNEYLALHPEYSYTVRPDDFFEGFQ